MHVRRKLAVCLRRFRALAELRAEVGFLSYSRDLGVCPGRCWLWACDSHVWARPIMKAGGMLGWIYQKNTGVPPDTEYGGGGVFRSSEFGMMPR